MPDPIGTALASIGAGAATGAAMMTAGVVVLRTVQRADASALSVDTGFLILSVAVVGGVVAAVASGWLLSRTIHDVWRRGVIAALSVFGASLLTLVAAPADMLAGRLGLVAYLVVLLVGAIGARAVARRAGAA